MLGLKWMAGRGSIHGEIRRLSSKVNELSFRTAPLGSTHRFVETSHDSTSLLDSYLRGLGKLLGPIL